MKVKSVMIGLALTSLLSAASDSTTRLSKSTIVLREISRTPDNGVPQDLLERAQCIVVVPGLKKIAFIGGGKYGKGFASCMTSKGWSAPAAIRIEGGSFGFQLGASATDVVMLVMNQGGMTKLTSDKFTIGGSASAAAGPVGRTASANTDVLMKAEILSYSRSRGLFAGISLEGATLRPDDDTNREIYGSDVKNLSILTGEVKRPAAAHAFLAQLQRFAGKGAPPVMKTRTRKNVSSNTSGNGETMGATSSEHTSADNTRMNKTHGVTADQSKNGSSDVSIARRIRRSIMSDKSLSTYGHNVKVIVQNGSVTLKGPVRSDSEKSSIEAKAAAVAGTGNVTNDLDVAPPK